MVGYANYLFLKTFIEDFTGLLYGWVWLKIVEITFLSLVTCYPLLEAVNLCLLSSYDLLNPHVPSGESHAPQNVDH
jgi:hypothetical protein